MTSLFHSPRFLRLYRLGVVILLGWLVHSQARWRDAQRPSVLTTAQAQKFFPDAAQLRQRDPGSGWHHVLDERGETLGALLTTSPQTDHIVGYSGPNNVLIALHTNGTVAGLELLNSGDTEDHVEMVLRDPEFIRAFVGWRPGDSLPPKVSGVAGATLTSFAIAEAIQQRLGAASGSLRFPEAITLKDVRTVFTNAASLAADGRRHAIRDTNGTLLGFALRTSPQADNVSGYRGPTDALVALAPDGRTVAGVRVLRSYDTPSYVDQIREDDYYLNLFRGRTLDELASLDFKREKIEGVSGATETSYALAEGLKRRAAAELQVRAGERSWRPRARDWGLVAMVMGAIFMAFSSLRGHRWLRVGWQVLLVGYVGLVNADLLSLALFGQWATHGIALKATPGLLFLAAAAFLVPLISRRQLYCHQICPHGAAQQLLGGLVQWRWTPSPSVAAWLGRLPVALLMLSLLAVLLGWSLDLADVEAFDAWSWRAAGVATLTLAVVGLIASLFIPQAYCRFGCPTGALLSFLRTSGSGDHWTRRDGAALVALVAAFAVVGVSRARPTTVERDPVLTMTGRTMGTTWAVKVRGSGLDPLRLSQVISNQFERCEQMTSHWRTNTAVARFNAARTTNVLALPSEVLALVRQSAGISRASGGAFDITVGPLARLWGFGPAPRRSEPPTEAELASVLRHVGWQKIEVAGAGLRKADADAELDLSAIVPGWAIDQVASLLEDQGCTEFLIESGGELRARGAWPIAIEHPTRTITLQNESLGTSGTYRQKWKSGGKQFSHLIDPRQGRPVSHRTVSVSVRHREAAAADAWAAALNVLGVQAGLPLAEQLGLAAQFVEESPEGALTVKATARWTSVPPRD